MIISDFDRFGELITYLAFIDPVSRWAFHLEGKGNGDVISCYS